MVFLLRGLVMITLSIQLITTEETHSTIDLLNSTDTPLNGNELKGIDSSKTCFTQPDLVLLEEAVVKVSVAEISEGNLQFLWDFLKKMYPDENPPMEKIVKQSFEEIKYCYGFARLLKFVDQSPDRILKLSGYQTLFSEVTPKTTSLPSLAPLLNLRHYITQDESINRDADFKTLLNNIESLTDKLLQSTQDMFDSSDVYGCVRSIVDFEYLTKRICSTYPDKIERLWSHLAGEHSLETLVKFISELEKNNRMNYTVLTIPSIKSELFQSISDQSFNRTCTLQRQLFAKLQTLPKDGPLKKLLSHSEFFIKNAYDEQYLHITGGPYNYFSKDHSRYVTNADRNLVWLIDFAHNHQPRDAVEIVNDRRLIGAKKCDTHGEWYPTDYLYQYYNSHGTWTFKIAESGKLRIQHIGSGGYLGVGNKDVVTISSLNENELSKFEWILESDSTEDSFDKEYVCTSRKSRKP